MELGPLLRAHGFLQVERPPELWDVEADDDPAAPVLVGADLDAAARAAGVRWAYTRGFAAGGSVTVLLPRAHS